MTEQTPLWRVYYDLGSFRVLSAAIPALSDALDDADHRMLRDHYAALASRWRQWGWGSHADALDAKAARHAAAAGDDDPPPAMAVGLPRGRYTWTDADGRVVQGPWRTGDRARVTSAPR